MRGMSYVHMAGTVGTAPELRKTRDGTPWIRVRLAVSRWDARHQKEATDWWTIKLFGTQATRAHKILQPGAGAVFRGIPQQESWTDAAGAQRQELSVRADSFQVVRFAPPARVDEIEPEPLVSMPLEAASNAIAPTSPPG